MKPALDVAILLRKYFDTIGLDTNVLARDYIDDAADEGARRQLMVAKRLIESGRALMVATSVLRGYYESSRKQIVAVFEHWLALPHVSVQNDAAVHVSLVSYGDSFDFADALHHASYTECGSVATFDD